MLIRGIIRTMVTTKKTKKQKKEQEEKRSEFRQFLLTLICDYCFSDSKREISDMEDKTISELKEFYKLRNIEEEI